MLWILVAPGIPNTGAAGGFDAKKCSTALPLTNITASNSVMRAQAAARRPGRVGATHQSRQGQGFVPGIIQRMDPLRGFLGLGRVTMTRMDQTPCSDCWRTLGLQLARDCFTQCRGGGSICHGALRLCVDQGQHAFRIAPTPRGCSTHHPAKWRRPPTALNSCHPFTRLTARSGRHGPTRSACAAGLQDLHHLGTARAHFNPQCTLTGRPAASLRG